MHSPTCRECIPVMGTPQNREREKGTKKMEGIGIPSISDVFVFLASLVPGKQKERATPPLRLFLDLTPYLQEVLAI